MRSLIEYIYNILISSTFLQARLNINSCTILQTCTHSWLTISQQSTESQLTQCHTVTRIGVESILFACVRASFHRKLICAIASHVSLRPPVACMCASRMFVVPASRSQPFIVYVVCCTRRQTYHRIMRVLTQIWGMQLFVPAHASVRRYPVCEVSR